MSWHLKAADQGYAVAQNHVGSCYQNGDGVPQDEAEAVRWYVKAAEQGYATAQANLGWCYDTGSGVAQGEQEAAKWYRKAAEQGDYTSQYNLGVHYEWGSGVEQDKKQALEWYGKSAEQGYEKAAEALKRLSDELAAEQEQVEQKTEETKGRFRSACKEALADGKISIDEKDYLKRLAESLGLSDEAVKQIFAEEKAIFLRQRKARDAEPKFRIACKNALADGKVEIGEKDELRALAKSLDIAKEDAKRLFGDERRIFKASQQVQPTRGVELQFRKACKKVLADGKVTPQEQIELKGLARFLKMSNEAMKQILADEIRIFKETRKAGPTKSAALQFRKACKKVLADGKVTPEEEKQLKSLAAFLKIPAEMMKQIFAAEAKLYQQSHRQESAT
jgi:tellurite resistance protein